jgi:hypothetical protein
MELAHGRAGQTESGKTIKVVLAPFIPRRPTIAYTRLAFAALRRAGDAHTLVTLRWIASDITKGESTNQPQS